MIKTRDSLYQNADSLTENTPNAPEFICQFVCPSPKVLDFNEKRLHMATVVRVFHYGVIERELQRKPLVHKGF